VYLNQKYYIESKDSFRFELDLLNHLDSLGIPVAPAIPMNNSELLGMIETKYGERAFSLFDYAGGEQMNIESFSPARCFQMGKTIAEFHVAANSFQSEHQRYHLDMKLLVDEPLRMFAKYKKTGNFSREHVQEARQLISSMQPISKLVEAVNSLDISGDAFGIIHGDINFTYFCTA